MNKTKNNIRFTCLLVMIFSVASCTTETQKEKTTEATEVEIPEQTPELIKEDFTAFFEQFSADSVFQLSRIDFPISYYMVDIEDNKEEYVYSKDEFGYIDFTKDEEAFKSKTNAYRPLIEKKNDTHVVYIKRGIDNGIRVEYYFEMNDKGKWRMVEVIDNST